MKTRILSWLKSPGEEETVDGPQGVSSGNQAGLAAETTEAPLDGSQEWRHANGQLRERQSYKNGVKDGPWAMFHTNGQLRSRGNYQDGLRNGPFEVYYSNGQLRSSGTHSQDKRSGAYVSHYENGQMDSRGSFVNGNKAGYRQSSCHVVIHTHHKRT